MVRASVNPAASAPDFFVAALLVLLSSVAFGWPSAFGGGSVSSWGMPGLSIALFPGAVLSRVVRVNLQDAMSQPFATTSLAKGLSLPGGRLGKALPNIAVPYLATFGARFTLMIIGSIIVENGFAGPPRRVLPRQSGRTRAAGCPSA